MANLNVQLAGANLQIIDNTASIQRVNSPIATILAQTAAAFYDPYLAIANPGPAVLGMPGATVWVWAVRNLSGANTVSLTATPTGGAAWASALVLPPNGMIICMATYSSSPAAGGITALSIGTNGAGTFVEILLAA